MRKLSLLALALAAGCGGSGGGSSVASPYTGKWGGGWDAPGKGANGSADIVIGTDGAVSGTIKDFSAGKSGTVSGSIAPDGTFSGTARYPGAQASTIGGKMARNGIDLSGTLTQTYNGSSWPVSFSLTKDGKGADGGGTSG